MGEPTAIPDEGLKSCDHISSRSDLAHVKQRASEQNPSGHGIGKDLIAHKRQNIHGLGGFPERLGRVMAPNGELGVDAVNQC